LPRSEPVLRAGGTRNPTPGEAEEVDESIKDREKREARERREAREKRKQQEKHVEPLPKSRSAQVCC